MLVEIVSTLLGDVLRTLEVPCQPGRGWYARKAHGKLHG